MLLVLRFIVCCVPCANEQTNINAVFNTYYIHIILTGVLYCVDNYVCRAR